MPSKLLGIQKCNAIDLKLPVPLGIRIFDYDLNGNRCVIVRQNAGTSIEFQGANRYRIAEVARKSKFVELFDIGHYIRVRLLPNHSEVNYEGRGGQHLYYGSSR